MVGASRFERPTTRTPNECATRLRHAPISLLFQYLQYFSQFLFRRFYDCLNILDCFAVQFPSCSGNRVTILIEQLFYVKDVVYILFFIKALSRSAFVGFKLRKLRLPIPEHVRFQARQAAHLANPVKKLTGFLGIR